MALVSIDAALRKAYTLLPMSDFLFTTPSFLRGMARTLDIGGVLAGVSYNTSKDGPSADAWAVANDWYAVGGDLRRAMSSAVGIDGEETEQAEKETV